MPNDEPISRDEALRVARLARLTVTDAEAEALTRDLAKILAYVHKLDELDVRDVEATSHAVELPTKLRPDEAAPGLSLEKAMQNAPERLGDGFGVPKIIE